MPSEVPSAALWLFAGLALLLVALAGFAAGRWQERERQRQALREVRAQGQLLAQLLDVWQWQSDRHHRLVRLQPPAGAPASACGAGRKPCMSTRLIRTVLSVSIASTFCMVDTRRDGQIC